jgi:hypothetical protein
MIATVPTSLLPATSPAPRLEPEDPEDHLCPPTRTAAA